MHRQRREKLARVLLGFQPDVRIYLNARDEPLMNRDNPYKYRPDSNFYYYTGLDKTDMAIMIHGNRDGISTTLYMPSPNPHKEKWTGPMTRFDDMKDIFDIVEPIERYCPTNEEGSYTDKNDLLVNCMDLQRVVKSSAEIEQIKRGCEASAQAFREIMTGWMDMRSRGELQSESALDGWFTYQFMKRGANGLAYPNIVASGKHATILHYEKNNGQIQNGNLVLVDAGGEYGYYASDITRTWPVNGKFTTEQKAIYDIVRNTQRSCIAMIKPDVHMIDIHEHAQVMIAESMQKLGLPANYDYFPHSIGHWMGIDVHDCMSYNWHCRSVVLQSNMVITIEPGIYVPDREDMGKYRGIGVRLEDDILVTDDGHYNLTSAAPFWENIDQDNVKIT